MGKGSEGKSRIVGIYVHIWRILVVQSVKNLPAVQETQVRSLSWEDPLEKEMASLLYSCLGNPMDRGAWQTTVHEVAELD